MMIIDISDFEHISVHPNVNNGYGRNKRVVVRAESVTNHDGCHAAHMRKRGLQSRSGWRNFQILTSNISDCFCIVYIIQAVW